MLVNITADDDGHFVISYDYSDQITALLKAATPAYARRWDSHQRAWIVDLAYPVRCFIEALRYRDHDVEGDYPAMPTCRQCDTTLDVRNITGICRECRHIARNERLGHTHTADQVTHDQAAANIAEIFGVTEERKQP